MIIQLAGEAACQPGVSTSKPDGRALYKKGEGYKSNADDQFNEKRSKIERSREPSLIRKNAAGAG